MVRSYLDMSDAISGSGGGIYSGQAGDFVTPLPVNPADFVHIVGEEVITGRKKFGSSTDYSTFDADGTLRYVGAATVWDDINVSMVPPAGDGAAPSVISFNGDARLDVYAFTGVGAVASEFHSGMEILHGYKEGSDIHFHLHWYPTNTTVANIKWQLRYTWFNPGTVPPAGATATVTAATSGVAWQEQTSVIVLSGAGKLMGSRLIFSLFRDPADAEDTYVFDAAVSDMGVHYEKDSEGSNTTLTK